MTSAEDKDDLLEWKKFLKGDDCAFVYLYRKYINSLFSFGMCFTMNRELVEDCIQEVFVSIYSRRKHLNETENIKFYLFKALKNMLFNAFQKDRPSSSLDSVPLSYSTDYTIEDQLIQDEQEQIEKDKIVHILELLSPHQKEAIYYRYMEEMSMDEICVMMNMNYQAIQNLLQRAIKKMRGAITEHNDVRMIVKKGKRCL